MKVLLLDADGVVLQKGEYFSERFAREYDIPLEKIIPFFKEVLPACQSGEKDLKEALLPFLEKWDWDQGVDAFLEYWFADVVPSEHTLQTIAEYRARGIACYLASNNEQYRARKIEDVLGDKLDGFFFSADLQVRKNDPEFFREVLERLGVPAAEVGFTDNDERNVDVAAGVGIDAKLYNTEVFSEFELTDGSEMKFI